MKHFKYLYFILLASFIIALDQWTKLLVYSQFYLGKSIPVIENYFHITYVRNYGAAFGFLADSNPVFRKYFFLALPPVAMVIILAILKGVPTRDKIQITALSLIFGGAIGNYLDRIRFGFVVDFLDVHYQNKVSWPAFNIADMAIVCGIAILIVLVKNDVVPEKAKK